MDIQKLKAMQVDLELQAKKEIYDNLPDELINFLKDDIVQYSLNEVKTRNNSAQSARVLNSWIEQGLLRVDVNDKGKVNRFTREETIWLNLLNELRVFGVSLDKLKMIREELFKESFPAFTLFRFTILRTILVNDQTLLVFSDGSIKLMSSNLYEKWLQRRMLPTHIHINFENLLRGIFPKNSFDLKIDTDKFLENTISMKILYFLKTGDFETFKFEITEGDVRLIEKATQFTSNKDLMDAVISERYFNAEVICDGKTFTIKT